jgi:outer membrane protease
LSFTLAYAQIAVERNDIICATLDAIELKFSRQDILAAKDKENDPFFKVLPHTKSQNFFSDFVVRYPFSHIFSLGKKITWPIFYFNGTEQTLGPSEQMPTQELIFNDEINFEDFTLLSAVDTDWVHFYLGTHVGYFNGCTNYEIGFDGGRSELEFPLKSIGVAGLKVVTVIPKIRLFLDNSGYISTRDRSGTMTDTDWDATETIISDTDSKAFLNLLIWDSSLGYAFWRTLSLDLDWNIALSLLGGYRYENFKYMIYDVNVSDTTLAEGPVLEYVVRYSVPYFGLKVNLSQQAADWGLSTKLCFSPFVQAKDFDDHLLRGKRAFGEGRGWAAMAGLNLFYNLNDFWTLQGGIDYARIRTSGEQVQIWYLDEGSTVAGTVVGGIDDDIFSNQVYYWGRINYKF